MTRDARSGDLVGQCFGKGRYVVEQRLGGGGFADVYRARDAAGLPVAMKFLRNPEADRVIVERFKREGQKFGLRFQHQNVARVLGCGNERERYFIVTEFVDGTSLDEEIRSNGPLAVGEALRITRDLADGLRTAHKAGVVHRDLKPANVMIRGEDRAVKIVDFGIAKDLLSSVGLRTRAGMGTVGYSAPEQMKGWAVDGRADIFGLGAILYEMLTKEYAFKGKRDAEIVKATLHADPIPPTRFNKAVTKPIVSLISMMIAKNRERRPADMGAVISAIDGIVAALPDAVDRKEEHGIRSWLLKLVGR